MRFRGFLVLPITAILLLGSYALAGPTVSGSKLSGEEVAKKWEELQKKQWSKSDFKSALGATRGDRSLFERYVKLREAKVHPGLIVATFKTCRYEPVLVSEYWDWVQKYEFGHSEVSQVMKNFPSNKVIRWYYFAYRCGGEQKLLTYETKKPDQNNKPKNPKKKEEERVYSQDEVMGVFRVTKFNMKFIKEYFDQRAAGKKPPEILPELKKMVEKQRLELEKEEKEKRRKAEEERQKKIEARKKMIELTTKPKDGEEEKKRATPGTPDDLDKILGLLPPDDEDDKKDEEKKDDVKKDEDEDKDKKEDDMKRDDEKKDDEDDPDAELED